MCRAVIDAVTASGKDLGLDFHIHKRDGNLSQLPLVADGELWFLIIRFHGIHPAGIRISLSVDLIPRAVEIVAELAVFLDASHLHHLVLAKMVDLVRTETRRIIQRNAADGHAPMLDRWGGKRTVEPQILQGIGKRDRGGEFQKVAARNLRVNHAMSLTEKIAILFHCYFFGSGQGEVMV